MAFWPVSEKSRKKASPQQTKLQPVRKIVLPWLIFNCANP